MRPIASANAGAPAGRPSVLVVTASVGAGHNQVARALMESFARMPDLKAECVDVMDFVPRLFRAYYAGGFSLAMSHFPNLYGLGYHVTNHPQRPGRAFCELPRLWMETRAARRLRDYLSRTDADLIVNTHFLSPLVVRRMVRERLIDTPQVVVVTDIETHRRWYCQDVDHWFVPSGHTAGIFRRWGVEDERITISGIPVRAKWSAPVDRAKVLSEWRLPGDRMIVLMAGGTQFTCGPMVDMARSLAAACDEAYVVVLAGRNKSLLSRLAMAPEAPGRLVGVAFTDRVHELVAVCALMVTKAGGVTTAECLAKGTPMILMKPVPGHEAGNAAWLARQGAAVVAPSYRRLPELVRGVLRDPEALAKLSAAARGLHRPATETVTGAIRRMVGLPAGTAGNRQGSDGR